MDFRDFGTLTPSSVKGGNAIKLIKNIALAGVVATLLCGPWSPDSGFGAAMPAAVSGQEDVAVTVHIENRRFIPHVVNLRVGQRVRLTFKNEDVELHAFVPAGLLVRTNVQVGGDGAPQFDKEGFRRVLIPSGGHAELVFTSKQAGSFPFFCDLPGHIMNGTIVVDG